MLSVLIVDDDQTPSGAAAMLLKELDSSDKYSATKCDFVKAREYITSGSYDVIVADIYERNSFNTQVPVGVELINWLTATCFRPVIAFSGINTDGVSTSHPFVWSVTKGSDATERVCACLEAIEPMVLALQDIESAVRGELALAMRDIAECAFRAGDNRTIILDRVVRGARRRVAARMDFPAESSALIAAWEHYIIPPIAQTVLVGDILKESACTVCCPAKYRVVLSPSCDMQCRKGGSVPPKIDKVLVANCVDVTTAIERAGNCRPAKIKNAAEMDKIAESMSDKVLRDGYKNGYVFMAGYSTVIPSMAIDLRNLEFVRIAADGVLDEKFVRIASVDSPFRELIQWAYLSVACRPGMPERDFRSWAVEIYRLVYPE